MLLKSDRGLVMRSHGVACLLVLTLPLGACFKTYKNQYQFDTGTMSEEQWKRVKQECDYEADKASASAPINIGSYVYENLYLKCVQLRGVKYNGKIRVAVE
jgi:hypothetical protein